MKQNILGKDGANYGIRAAGVDDFAPVTQLLHQAFDAWTKADVIFKAASQSVEHTASHLAKNAFVITTPTKEIVATFSLSGAYLELHRHLLWFTEGREPAIPYFFLQDFKEPSALKLDQYLVFKKFAVRPDHQSRRIGAQAYQAIEGHAKSAYCGILVEAVKEASWVYEWYLRLGFLPIAVYRYPTSQHETYLMMKNL